MISMMQRIVNSQCLHKICQYFNSWKCKSGLLWRKSNNFWLFSCPNVILVFIAGKECISWVVLSFQLWAILRYSFWFPKIRFPVVGGLADWWLDCWEWGRWWDGWADRLSCRHTWEWVQRCLLHSWPHKRSRSSCWLDLWRWLSHQTHWSSYWWCFGLHLSLRVQSIQQWMRQSCHEWNALWQNQGYLHQR